jgi:methylated-DNA-[protein]-cysteine S-methyltransferase
VTWRTTIATEEGLFEAVFSDHGLAELSFPNGKLRSEKDAEAPREWKEQTALALKTVLGGKQPSTLPPLDLSRGTKFQQAVWKALLGIPAGQTRSYSEVARAIGVTTATRAVGAACGANPIPVLVPCHRVLAAGGKLGGFSAGWKWKRLLLRREGVLLT